MRFGKEPKKKTPPPEKLHPIKVKDPQKKKIAVDKKRGSTLIIFSGVGAEGIILREMIDFNVLRIRTMMRILNCCKKKFPPLRNRLKKTKKR